MTPRPAYAWERPAALTLFFQHQGEAERGYRVSHALDMLARGDLAPRGLIVLPGTSSLAGVIICQSVPGGGGLIWPPALVSNPPSTEHEDALIAAACGSYDPRGHVWFNVCWPTTRNDPAHPCCETVSSTLPVCLIFVTT